MYCEESKRDYKVFSIWFGAYKHWPEGGSRVVFFQFASSQPFWVLIGVLVWGRLGTRVGAEEGEQRRLG